MGKRNVRTQISNIKTTDMYRKQMISLACNVFNFKNLTEESPFMDLSYVNRELVHKGSIAFFMDEYLGLLALPYVNRGRLDLYGRPIDIQVIGKNGYTRGLKYGEYVIMYDNMIRYPLIFAILQYSERVASITRTIDINTVQQRTPRIWKTKTENLKTIQDVIDGIDSNNEAIVTYDNLELDDTTVVLEPAPFIADKLSEQKDKIWNEFLRLIGIANTSFQKKERNIQDEVFISQAGTIASRYSRFEARREAIDKINKKWNLNIEVEYYDGLPTTLTSPENEYNSVTSKEVYDDRETNNME